MYSFAADPIHTQLGLNEIPLTHVHRSCLSVCCGRFARSGCSCCLRLFANALQPPRQSLSVLVCFPSKTTCRSYNRWEERISKLTWYLNIFITDKVTLVGQWLHWCPPHIRGVRNICVQTNLKSIVPLFLYLGIFSYKNFSSVGRGMSQAGPSTSLKTCCKWLRENVLHFVPWIIEVGKKNLGNRIHVCLKTQLKRAFETKIHHDRNCLQHCNSRIMLLLKLYKQWYFVY